MSRVLGPGARDRPLIVEGDVVLVHAPSASRGLCVEADRTLELAPGSTLIANGRVSLDGTAVVCSLAPR